MIEQCCGKCMHHLPYGKPSEKEPKEITSGKGKGKKAYWVCKCKDSKYYNTGRISEDGVKCTRFINRYESDKNTDLWVNKCYEIEVPKQRGYTSEDVRQRILFNRKKVEALKQRKV